MKAAVLNRISGGFEIENINIDDPSGREVLVAVKAAGLCHSDLHLAQADYGIPLPAVFGHELAGVVEKIGPEVSEFAVGDHVVGSLVQFCGHCSPCGLGHTWQCDHPERTLRTEGNKGRLNTSGRRLTQVFGMGAFAEKSLVHENQLVKIPDDVPFAPASILGCGVVTGLGAVFNTAGVRPGQTVVVLGVGGVGLNVVAGARLAGASRIIAVDTHSKKESLARSFGATDFVNASLCDSVAAVLAATPAGVDHTFEVIGLKETMLQAIRMTRKGGAMYVIGLPKPGTELSVEVHPQLIRRQITICGVYMGSSNIKRDIPMYAEFYRQGRLDLDRLISREINIHEINEAYRALEGGELARSVITSFHTLEG
jgi:S-(hydroxymethyl)glutathione dehydrogenase/alcohol dehydrogenase